MLDAFASGACALTASLALAFASGANAQSCPEADFDGDGAIATWEIGWLSSQLDALSGCLDVDLRRRRYCRAHDLDRTGAVDGVDLVTVDRVLGRFSECLGPMVAARPGCAAFDLDGDGGVGVTDASGLIMFRQETEACLGEDVRVDACEQVDFDHDARITLFDVSQVASRYPIIDHCDEDDDDPPDDRPGLWVDRERILSLPTFGPAWDRLYAEAMRPPDPPALADLEDRSDTHALARALVGLRLGDAALLESVRETLARFVAERSELGGETLALARNVVGYVLAADLIELERIAPDLDAAFRARLDALRHVVLRGRTLLTTHAERPNNWGTHAGAARIAIALYLGDAADLAEAVEIHRAWLGEASTHRGFRFGEPSWQADPSRPVGVNPRGARRGGLDVDGALPEEMRRGGVRADPPGRTGYAWEALQGATVATELLARGGHLDAWRWGDDALGRAVDYLYRLDERYGGWAATGDDRWNLWLINHATGSELPALPGVSVGKNMGFTDWTHAD